MIMIFVTDFFTDNLNLLFTHRQNSRITGAVRPDAPAQRMSSTPHLQGQNVAVPETELQLQDVRHLHQHLANHVLIVNQACSPSQSPSLLYSTLGKSLQCQTQRLSFWTNRLILAPQPFCSDDQKVFFNPPSSSLSSKASPFRSISQQISTLGPLKAF